MSDRLALTVVQPWATLIATGVKRVENRTWKPWGLKPGDYLAIHAGKKIDWDAWPYAIEMARDAGLLGTIPVLDGALALPKAERGDRFGRARERLYAETACPYSAIIAVAKLDEARQDPRPGDPWWAGPIGWYLRDVVALKTPVPCRGAQGLWQIPEDVLLLVRQELVVSKRGLR